MPAIEQFITKSLTAVGSAILPISDQGSAAVQLTGTFVGTITFEVSIDGTTYVGVNGYPSTTVTAALTATAPGIWRMSVSSYSYVRARCSAYTSGTIVVSLKSSQAPLSLA